MPTMTSTITPTTATTPTERPALTHLLYLHGFRSSPQSMKARKVADWVSRHRPDLRWACPQLPPSPREAMALIESLTADWPAVSSAVIGSSLGGFYALAHAQRRGWRTVLINPAVFPARDLARYIGEQGSWHDPTERFWFRPEFIDELRALEPPTPLPHPERLLSVIAQGDEVLDWREMLARCGTPPAQVRLVEGSDHALSDFDTHWPAMIGFLGL